MRPPSRRLAPLRLAHVVSLVFALLVAACTSSSDAPSDAPSAVPCAPPSTRCDGRCVDPRSDARHCGACGRACGSSERCDDARCLPRCATGLGDCDGDPANGCETVLSANRAHCGACGNACAAGVPCWQGACGCRAGTVACGDVCVDLATSASHCGACGHPCATVDGLAERCVRGACVPGCATGFGDCDGRDANGCETDLARDAANCGTCGFACGPDMRCEGGRCVCPAGRGDCDGRLDNGCEADVTSDRTRCGACEHTCSVNEVCMASRCVCREGFAACGFLRECTDLQHNANACGTCDRVCRSGASCEGGECVCDAGRLYCEGTGCVDARTSATNCGACGRACAAGMICRDGRCACATGLDDCGADGCVDLRNDPRHCGACDLRCPYGRNERPLCNLGRCTVTCDIDAADCDGVRSNGCEVDVWVDSANCGACGVSCPAEQTCIYGRCDCTASRLACEGRCFDPLTSVEHCAVCGRRCLSGWVCALGRCEPPCVAPWTRCGTTCVALDADPSHCGSCSAECNTSQRCVAGVCVETVRPLAPRSASWVQSVRPRFRWSLQTGTTGVRLQVCRTRACTAPVIDETVGGNTWRPSTPLARGTYFWRLFATRGAAVDATPGPTWMFRMETRADTPTGDGTWGAIPDFDGDGYDDVVVGAPGASSSPGQQPGRFFVYRGGPTGPSPDAWTPYEGQRRADSTGEMIGPAGDVNGDGYADLFENRRETVRVYLGGARGLSPWPQLQIDRGEYDVSRAIASAGDVSGDGYDDLVLTRFDGTFGGVVTVHYGGPEGLASTASVRIPAATQGVSVLGVDVVGVGDVNSDGYSDVAASGRIDGGGSTSGGYVLVYLGGGLRLSSAAQVALRSPVTPTDVSFGSVLAAAGDVDGDGYADLAVGDVRFDRGSTTVSVFRGSEFGTVLAPSRVFRAETPGGLGWSFAGLGDVNGDGYGDFALARTLPQRGITVHSGSASGVAEAPSLTLTVPPNASTTRVDVVRTGDLDGDGRADLLASNRRAVFVYANSAAGLARTPSITLTGPASYDVNYGASIAHAPVATPTRALVGMARAHGTTRPTS